MSFGIRLPALAATEPAQAVTMPTEAGASDIAVLAVHGYFRFGHCFHTCIILESLAVLQALILFLDRFSSGIRRLRMGLSERVQSAPQTIGRNYVMAVVASASPPLLSQAFRGWRDQTPFSRFYFGQNGSSC